MQLSQTLLTAIVTVPAATAFMTGTGPTSLSAATKLSATLNGWIPDESKFAYGLPGTIVSLVQNKFYYK